MPTCTSTLRRLARPWCRRRREAFLVMVPATMELLGDRGWHLSCWLERALSAGNVDGPAPLAIVGGAR